MTKKNRPEPPENSNFSDEYFPPPTARPVWSMIVLWSSTAAVLAVLVWALIQSRQLIVQMEEQAERDKQSISQNNIEHLFWVISQDDASVEERTEAFTQLVKIGNDNWLGPYLTGLKLNGIDLAGTEFKKANFKACKLKNADLSESVFFNCSFELSDLSKSNLRLADLSESYFFKTELTGANLQLARMRKVDLHQAIIKNANLQFCEMPESSLRMADFTDSDLLDAELVGCDLTDAKFVRCNLKNVKLPFREEAFLRTDFTDSNWWEAKFMPGKVIDRCIKEFAPSKKTSETMRVKYKLWLDKEGGDI